VDTLVKAAQLSPVSEPFWEDEEYLVVADYKQENIYQLKPLSRDLRALPMRACKPVSVTFDPSINGLYVICHQSSRYHIQKKTFDGTVDEIIHNASNSTLARNIVCHDCFISTVVSNIFTHMIIACFVWSLRLF